MTNSTLDSCNICNYFAMLTSAGREREYKRYSQFVRFLSIFKNILVQQGQNPATYQLGLFEGFRKS